MIFLLLGQIMSTVTFTLTVLKFFEFTVTHPQLPALNST